MIGAVILQVVLIALNAVFASAEIAVISMNEMKLKMLTEQGDKRAGKLSRLTKEPARFLATIQVAITLAGFLGSAFAADNFAGPLVSALLKAGVPVPESVLNSIAVVLITLILSYFSLVLGELVPKRIAMKKTEEMALGMAGTLSFVSKAFAPLVALLTASTNGILRLLGIAPSDNDDEVTEEEIQMVLLAGNKQGIIDSDETEMIQNIFEFDDIPVSQVCTHRIKVTALYTEDSMEEWDRIIRESYHTYYPVCRESRDNIEGILDTKLYFRMADRSREKVMKEAVQPAYFVPEAMKANVLFQNMKKSRSCFAVVIDEYGGMTGIVTLRDLIEELVGDWYEPEEQEKSLGIRKTGQNKWEIQGYAQLDDVAEALGIELPTDVYDTFNGFLCDIIGKVPGDGESFTCEYENLKIDVHSVKKHRIGSTTVILTEKPEEET